VYVVNILVFADFWVGQYLAFYIRAVHKLIVIVKRLIMDPVVQSVGT
jgi:hypothetical protein